MNKLKKGRKAQLQSSETIFAVFIIIIIIILGIVFYSRVEEGRLKEKEREARALRLVSLAHTISSWPELECSVLRSRDFNCIDRSKLDILPVFITDSKAADSYFLNYYTDLLRRSAIVVREEYTFTGVPSKWVIYNNSFKALSQQEVSVPVSIYDPVSQKYSYGVMELTVYE